MKRAFLYFQLANRRPRNMQSRLSARLLQAQDCRQASLSHEKTFQELSTKSDAPP